MDRMVCVDVPALPLQILLRRHPEWKKGPAAVVDHDRAQGVILWVNEHARRHRILPGMRFATGLSLSRDLQSGTIDEEDIQVAIADLLRILWDFSPHVEPSSTEPGTFWMGTQGLDTLYPSLDAWAKQIRVALSTATLFATVALGHSRFGTYAAAKTTRTTLRFDSYAQERAYVETVPIDRMRIEPTARDTLLKLGVKTLGAFMALAPDSVRRRFPEAACELHRLARGDAWEALDPRPMIEAVRRELSLEHPETDLARLMLVIEPLMHSMMQELATRKQVMLSIHCTFTLDDHSTHSERLAPACPTIDTVQMLPLIRLRLESLKLSSGVVDFKLQTDGVAATRRQLELFRQSQERDLAAVRRAFAEIRANLGPKAVVHAALHARHLPEARYAWEPITDLQTPAPRRVQPRPLIRRIFSPPLELRSRLRHEPDGWIIGRMADGPVEEVVGPHMVSGGWWSRDVARAYYFVRTRSGRWFWIYNDRIQRRWFLQGEVE